MNKEINEDLRRWFKEKWVDISKKDASGKHPPCGRTKSKKKGYPKCRPSRRVSSETPQTSGEMSPERKKKAVAQKRAAERKPRKGKKPKMTSHHTIDEGFGKQLLGGLAAGGLIGFGAAQIKNAQNQQQAPEQRIATVAPAAPVVTQQKPQIKQEQPKQQQFQFHNDHVKRLYGALVSAEHRGHVKDPYAYDPNLAIRTKAGKGTSSAYGPLQITRNTARGYMDPNNQYHAAFVDQGSKFLKAKTNDPVHGLGGEGTLSGEDYHDDYQSLAQHVMFGKAKELKIDITKPLNQNDLDRFVQHWRHGKESGKSPEKWYTDTTRQFYLNK